MKLYVAGKWEDRENVKVLMADLKDHGHTITCDWTDHKYEDEAYPKQYCEDDAQGVRSAEAYIGVFEKDFNYRGALVEWGIALGVKIPVILYGDKQDGCIFANHPLVTKCRTWPEVLKAIEKP